MSVPVPQIASVTPSGSWQVYVKSRGGSPRNVTVFRGAPTQVESVTTGDPFGPKAASLVFPAITMLDRPGVGDLDWLEEEADVDLVWLPPKADGEEDWEYQARIDRDAYVWEGYMTSYDYSPTEAGGQLTVACLGAMYQLDNYLAKPAYLYRPVAYEYAIKRCFDDKPDLRMTWMVDPTLAFPDWWTTTFNRADYASKPPQPWLLPEGPANGSKWSGMVTRETGHFEPMLTNYVQGLLSNMHTERGQFTLVLDRGRRPRLAHRERLSAPAADTLVVDLLAPGVRMSATRDFTQRAGVIYGQGKSASGDTWSGMEVTSDGSSTYYDPLASHRVVDPPEPKDNPWLDTSVMRRELNLSLSDGLDLAEAKTAAGRYLQRLADPGVTGQLTITSDPVTVGSSTPVPRQTVTAGRTVLVKGLFGVPGGVLFHITETSLSADGEATWTVDSLFRDQLTVDQVRRRGRDALVPYRMLSTSGTYDPRIPDLLFPWSYTRGSGIVPWGAKTLFTRLGPAATKRAGATNPTAEPFPWTGFTRAYPPRKYPQFYMRVPPANWSKADYNWANSRWSSKKTAAKNLENFRPYPVLLAASGQIKLVQFAAYDIDGNVKEVPFHVSIYRESGINVGAMPMLPPDSWKPLTGQAQARITKGSTSVVLANLPKGHGIRVGQLLKVDRCSISIAKSESWYVTARTATTVTVGPLAEAAGKTAKARARVLVPFYTQTPHNYLPGQHYPFSPGAWERITPQGMTPTNVAQVTAANTMIAGWGNYYEKAGYWPGSSTHTGDKPTGLLVDESGFTFDFRAIDGSSGVDVQQPGSVNSRVPMRVMAYVMLYCDEDAVNSTFFLGRLWRQEYQGT